MMTAWALASPLMSSPDEPSHAIRAGAVVRGDFTGTPSPSLTDTEVQVPEYLADSAKNLGCYAFKAEVNAGCQFGSADNELVTGRTQSTLNTPVFYAIAGLPTLVLDGNAAIYAMRLVVVLMSAALLAVMFQMLRTLPNSRWAMIAGAVSVTPMVLFLSGSVNPNAIEVSAAAALYTSLLVTFRVPTVHTSILWQRIATVVIATFLLVNTRSISLIWLLIIFAMALLFSKREALLPLFKKAPFWIGVGVAGVAVASAGIWYLLPKGLVQMPGAPDVGRDWGWGFGSMLDRTLEDGRGWVGVFGWLDTVPPGIVYAIWSAAVIGLVVAALTFASARGRTVMIGWALILVCVPAIIQATLIQEWGWVWQGRYSLALFVCMVLTAGVVLDAQLPRIRRSALTGKVVVALGGALAVGHIVAFAWALRRYVVGLSPDQTWLTFLLEPSWQPPVHSIVLIVVFGVLLVIGIVALRRGIASSETQSEREDAEGLANDVRVESIPTPAA